MSQTTHARQATTVSSGLDPVTLAKLQALRGSRQSQRSTNNEANAEAGRTAHVARAKTYCHKMLDHKGGYKGRLVFDYDAATAADAETGRKRSLRQMHGAVRDTVDAMFSQFVELDLEAYNEGRDPKVRRVTAVQDAVIDILAELSVMPTDTQYRLAAEYFRAAIQATFEKRR